MAIRGFGRWGQGMGWMRVMWGGCMLRRWRGGIVLVKGCLRMGGRGGGRRVLRCGELSGDAGGEFEGEV